MPQACRKRAKWLDRWSKQGMPSCMPERSLQMEGWRLESALWHLQATRTEAVEPGTSTALMQKCRCHECPLLFGSCETACPPVRSALYSASDAHVIAQCQCRSDGLVYQLCRAALAQLGQRAKFKLNNRRQK